MLGSRSPSGAASTHPPASSRCSRAHTVPTQNKSARRACRTVTFDHPGGTGHRLEQLPGLLPHHLDPRAPVPEQLLGISHVLPLVYTLKHQPHLVGHARHTPFRSHRLPLLGFLLRPVHPVLQPHPTRPFQLLALSGVTPALDLPNLVARLHHILDDMELVVHHLRISEVVTHPLDVGCAHVDGHVLDGLGMPVMTQQFRSKSLPNRRILAGSGEEDSLGQQVSEHRQVVVPFAPVYLVGPHPDHVLEAQPLIRRLHVGEKSLLPRIWPERLTGISRMRVRATASNSWVKCLLRPSQGGVTRYTVLSSPRRPSGRARTIKHSLLKTFRCRHCIGSTWSWQVTGVLARELSSGHKSGVSSTFRKNVEDSGSNRDSTTLQLFPSPSNCPKVCSGVIDRHHPPPVKPPLPTGNSEETKFCKSEYLQCESFK